MASWRSARDAGEFSSLSEEQSELEMLIEAEVLRGRRPGNDTRPRAGLMNPA